MDPREGQQQHDDLMKRHQNRREINWVPFTERRSEGRLHYADLGAQVRVEMDVIGLGTIVLIAEAKYCDYLKHYRWNQDAELRSILQDPAEPLPPSLLRRVV
jgi:hypothetical protein